MTMRFSRILLITPPVKTEIGPVRPSMGLGYLAQVLESNGIDYDILICCLDIPCMTWIKRLKILNPTFWEWAFQQQIQNRLWYDRTCKNDAPWDYDRCRRTSRLLLRGKVLTDCQSIDYAVVLEGEYPLLELCQGMPVDRIGNMIYRDEKTPLSQIRYGRSSPAWTHCRSLDIQNLK